MSDLKKTKKQLIDDLEMLRGREREQTADQLKKTDQQYLNIFSQQLLQAQERERQMISYELHDRIAQDLSALKIGLDTLLDDQPFIQEDLRHKTRKLSDVIVKAIQSVRNLSYELRPPDLDEMNTVNALKTYTEEFADMSGIKIEFLSNVTGRLHLDSDSKIHLYRLVQEGLRNTQKHAQADTVWIELNFASANIFLSIKDNGIGFDVKERERRLDNEKRLGLRSMRERVNLLGGQIKIQSRPGEGTTISIQFPLRDKFSGAENTHINH